MKREMVKIDEDLCNGCGDCVPNCHEGALQIVDGKAVLISDLMCDGLGACIGYCPQGAIEIELREAEPYNETKVMELMIPKGKNTVIAHLKHLKEHNEVDYLKEGVRYLKQAKDLPFNFQEVVNEVHGAPKVFQPTQMAHAAGGGGGCPGSQARTIVRPEDSMASASVVAAPSELRQWPVQLHLVNPSAAYFQQADVVVAADCVAFAMGDFHARFLKGKSVVIACPKLDAGMDIYKDKITALVNNAHVNTITVVIMQVPCCGGLLQVVQQGVAEASNKVPVKLAIVSVEGKVLEERWV